MSAKFSTTQTSPKKKANPIADIPKKELLQSDIPQISISTEKLPSKGIPYAVGSVIQYRPYTFGEVKKASQSKLDTKASFDFVLKGVETPFDQMDLTVGDFFYLGLLRRLSTLGSDKMMLPYRCDGCKKISKYITETTNISFDDMEASELPVIAEFKGHDIEFNPLTLKGLYELIDLDKHSDEIALLAKQCTGLEFEEAYNFISNANPQDSLLINEVDKILYHSIADMKFNCKELIDGKECGKQNTIELDGGQALIMPFREREESIRSKIHFGKSNGNKPS